MPTLRGPAQERIPMYHFDVMPPPDPRMTMMSTTQRPMSTFSMTTVAYASPSNNPTPSNEELYDALRTYLSTQDLMTVTKKYVS